MASQFPMSHLRSNIYPSPGKSIYAKDLYEQNYNLVWICIHLYSRGDERNRSVIGFKCAQQTLALIRSVADGI